MPKFGERRTDVNRFVRWSMSHEQSSLVRRSVSPDPWELCSWDTLHLTRVTFTLRRSRLPAPDPRPPTPLSPHSRLSAIMGSTRLARRAGR